LQNGKQRRESVKHGMVVRTYVSPIQTII